MRERDRLRGGGGGGGAELVRDKERGRAGCVRERKAELVSETKRDG